MSQFNKKAPIASIFTTSAVDGGWRPHPTLVALAEEVGGSLSWTGSYTPQGKKSTSQAILSVGGQNIWVGWYPREGYGGWQVEVQGVRHNVSKSQLMAILQGTSSEVGVTAPLNRAEVRRREADAAAVIRGVREGDIVAPREAPLAAIKDVTMAMAMVDADAGPSPRDEAIAQIRAARPEATEEYIAKVLELMKL